jgi:hypothetical protein
MMVLWNFSRNLFHSSVPVAFVKLYRKYEFLCVVIFIVFHRFCLVGERFHETVILGYGRFQKKGFLPWLVLTVRSLERIYENSDKETEL